MKKFAVVLLCFGFLVVAVTCLQADTQKPEANAKITQRADGVWVTLPSPSSPTMAFYQQGQVPVLALWANPKTDQWPAMAFSVQDDEVFLQVCKKNKVVNINLFELMLKVEKLTK